MANDWIKWEGGECPVHGAYRVEYTMRNGEIENDRADLLSWIQSNCEFDIIAYRLHQPESVSTSAL